MRARGRGRRFKGWRETEWVCENIEILRRFCDTRMAGWLVLVSPLWLRLMTVVIGSWTTRTP